MRESATMPANVSASGASDGNNCAMINAAAKLPAACVDLAFADPPYNLSNGGTTCQSGKRVSVNKADWDASRGVFGDHRFHRAWLRTGLLERR